MLLLKITGSGRTFHHRWFCLCSKDPLLERVMLRAAYTLVSNLKCFGIQRNYLNFDNSLWVDTNRNKITTVVPRWKNSNRSWSMVYFWSCLSSREYLFSSLLTQSAGFIFIFIIINVIIVYLVFVYTSVPNAWIALIDSDLSFVWTPFWYVDFRWTLMQVGEDGIQNKKDA